MKVEPPSLAIPEAEKRTYTEAEVHSKLFEADMVALGYPRRTNTQADGEWFQEQRTLALRRLRSKRDRGHHDVAVRGRSHAPSLPRSPRQHAATLTGAYPAGGCVVLLAGPSAASRRVAARSGKW